MRTSNDTNVWRHNQVERMTTHFQPLTIKHPERKYQSKEPSFLKDGYSTKHPENFQERMAYTTKQTCRAARTKQQRVDKKVNTFYRRAFISREKAIKADSGITSVQGVCIKSRLN